MQSSVSYRDLLFIPIVYVQWPMIGRPAWCHIFGEKNVSTLWPNPVVSILGSPVMKSRVKSLATPYSTRNINGSCKGFLFENKLGWSGVVVIEVDWLS